MATVNEKDIGSDDGSGSAHPEYTERPKGFRGFYSHPSVQVAMLGLVCFMCPGLFNSLSGIGGGGQENEVTGANTNVALYSTFAIMAFFAGSVNNVLGSRLTLQLGSLGYCLYIAGFLSLNLHPGADGSGTKAAKSFCIATGAILGLCAGLLWTAQGSIMLAYPTEQTKARYIAIFWVIFNLGGVVGSAVAFGQNFHTKAGSVNNGTYIVFLVLTLVGATIPMFMVDPKKMIRTDGTRVSIARHSGWKVEVWGLWVALRTDPMIVLLFPMFFASNWFYTWQFNEYNGVLFNIRTRSLDSMLYWSSQIVGSLIMATVLDKKNVSRRTRAFTGWGITMVMVMVCHGWAYHYQKSYTRESIAAIAATDRIDFSDKQYVGKIFLYIFFGILDAMWQTSVYWMMGAMSNDPKKLAYFTGFYKSIQSAGAAGSWRADAVLVPFMNMLAATWALCAAGLLFALPMIYLRVKDHTELEDETIARLGEHGEILPVEEIVPHGNVEQKDGV